MNEMNEILKNIALLLEQNAEKMSDYNETEFIVKQTLTEVARAINEVIEKNIE